MRVQAATMPLNEAAILATIREWVEIESQTADTAGVEAMLDAVIRAFAGLPVAIERVAGRDGYGGMVKVASPNPAGEAVGLVLCHVDTVHPKGTLKGRLPWRIDGDRVYGPGLYDMKGGACLAVAAYRGLIEAGIATARPMVFLFTPDEEVGSPTSRVFIEQEAKKAAYVLVTEPARDGGQIVTARKGVGRFSLTAHGRPAHAGSRHQDGRSAIREAAHQILAIEALTDYSRAITTTVGMVQGGTAGNVTPEFCRIDIDLRVPTRELGEELTAHILGLKPQTPDVTLDIEGEFNRPPYPKTPEIAALFKHAKDVAATIGFTLVDCPMTGGGSDGNFTAGLGIPTLDGLGIDGAGAHTMEEYGLISSILPRTRLLAGLMETVR